MLLRADLTGHIHPTVLAERAWMAMPVRPALKRTPVQDFNSSTIMFYYFLSTKNIEALFHITYLC